MVDSAIMSDSGTTRTNLRPVSRESGFKKLRALKCFEEVHQAVLDGLGATALAQLIQEERQEYLDVTRASLIVMLDNYRASLPAGEVVARRLPATYGAAIKKLHKSVDEVQELEWLTRFQKRRLRIDGNTETKINKLLPTMTQEVRAHVEVLRTLASVKMDLGLNKRHLGSLEVDATLVADVVERYGTADIAKVLQSAESRQKVMGVAERFLALAQKEIGGSGDEATEDAVVDAVPVEPEVPPPPTKASEAEAATSDHVVASAQGPLDD